MATAGNGVWIEVSGRRFVLIRSGDPLPEAAQLAPVDLGFTGAASFVRQVARDPNALRTLDAATRGLSSPPSLHETDGGLTRITEQLRRSFFRVYRDTTAPTLGPIRPFAPPESEPPPEGVEVETTFIEIELLDEEGEAVPGAVYQITLPDGSTRGGTLDGAGRARVDGIRPGTCMVAFPKMSPADWRAGDPRV